MSSSMLDFPVGRALRTADFVEDPTLLTRRADPDTAIHSFEGRVGNAYRGDVIITSPNTNVLYAPPINECRTRLRKDLHFGPDDPLFHPQPFNRPIAHLAVIRTPSSSSDHPLLAAWKRPQSQDFAERAALDVCPGLGKLPSEFLLPFQHLASSVFKRAVGKEEDFYIGTQLSELRALLERLESQWASRDVTFLRFALAQRQYLELLARLDWLDTYKDRYMKRVEIHPTSPEIMGAFAEDLDVVNRLFYAGIPLWYVRPIAQSLDVRIDRVGRFIVKRASKIEVPYDYELSVQDAQPSHRVIYTGLANKPERYAAMASYTYSLLQYPTLFGSSQPRSSTSVIRTSLAASSTVSDARKRHAPYRKPVKPSASRNHDSNTFIDPVSPYMPPASRCWASSLRKLSNHNNALRSEDDVECGFSLPPPRLFVNPERDDIKAHLLSMWLKLRLVLLYCISTEARWFSNKQWRSLLMLGSAGASSSNKKKKLQSQEMLSILRDSVDKSGLSLKIENLDQMRPLWKGKDVGDGKVLDPPVAREIIWEINELNFRQELLVLDTRLDGSGMFPVERKQVLDRCWSGSADAIHTTLPSRGLGAAGIEERVRFVAALHRLMSTWKISKPVELLDRFPDNPTAHNFFASVEQVEGALASSYTQAALEVLGRAASIPRHP